MYKVRGLSVFVLGVLMLVATVSANALGGGSQKELALRPWLQGVAYGNGLFMAVGKLRVSPGGYLKGSIILTSREGDEWTEHVWSKHNFTRVDFLNGRFYLTGSPVMAIEQPSSPSEPLRQRTIPPPPVLFTMDGTEVKSAKGITIPGRSTIAAEGRFVSVRSEKVDPILRRLGIGSQVGPGRILVSQYLKRWTETIVDFPCQQIAFGNGIYVLLGNEYKQRGQSFLLRPVVVTAILPEGPFSRMAMTAANKQMYGLAFGNGRFVAVGYRDEFVPEAKAAVVVSDDGKIWRPVPSVANTSLMAVTFGAGKFVAVSDNGSIFVSSKDGESWRRVRSGTIRNEGVNLDEF